MCTARFDTKVVGHRNKSNFDNLGSSLKKSTGAMRYFNLNKKKVH